MTDLLYRSNLSLTVTVVLLKFQSTYPTYFLSATDSNRKQSILIMVTADPEKCFNFSTEFPLHELYTKLFFF